MAPTQTDFASNDPTLRPPKYQRRRADMYRAVIELLEDQPHYTIVSKDEAASRVVAQRRAPLGAVDDVEVWIEGEPNGPVSVHVRSKHRRGLLDLGCGRRNIREFTRLLHHRQS